MHEVFHYFDFVRSQQKSYFYEKKHKNNIIPSSDEKLELQ